MTTLYLASLIGKNLYSRISVHDLKQYIENTPDNDFIIDFHDVQFIARSFLDEFYNVFIKNVKDNNFTFSINNLPSDASIMLNSVSKTQKVTSEIKKVNSRLKVTIFKSAQDAEKYFQTASF